MVLTALCALYGYRNKQQLLSYATLNRLVFKTEVERVYCAVCTETSYKTDTFGSLRVNVSGCCHFGTASVTLVSTPVSVEHPLYTRGLMP